MEKRQPPWMLFRWCCKCEENLIFYYDIGANKANQCFHTMICGKCGEGVVFLFTCN